MRVISLFIVCMLARPATGQQTDVYHSITGASVSMTTTTLASAGLPSYSQLTLVDTSVVTVGVEACPAGGYSLDDAQTCTLCPAGAPCAS